MDKPREIEAKVGRIRPVGRETYDRRALSAVPSATGGRPATSAPSTAVPLAVATGNETTPQPLGNISGLMSDGRVRYAKQSVSFLPSVQLPNRTLEEYTINNADMVNITASYLDKVRQTRPELLAGFDSPFEAAQWAVAQIQRSFEPGSAPRMVDTVHQSRTGRRVYQYLRQIEEALNVES